MMTPAPGTEEPWKIFWGRPDADKPYYCATGPRIPVTIEFKKSQQGEAGFANDCSTADIAKTAPSGGRPSLHISLKPLSRLARRLGGDGRVEWGDDGFSLLSSGVKEYLVTSSSVEIDHERSGGTVPSSVEKRQDPDLSRVGGLKAVY
ncbi:hypothetical protein V502_01025 [Pseudogymnoascus sp. VKM F-4520 (FW-2644)]|nr:hypothetical protein V502_01025 [Pseudogymnoascus sp. VKM F-4520 (FW-2644)]